MHGFVKSTLKTTARKQSYGAVVGQFSVMHWIGTLAVEARREMALGFPSRSACYRTQTTGIPWSSAGFFAA